MGVLHYITIIYGNPVNVHMMQTNTLLNKQKHDTGSYLNTIDKINHYPLRTCGNSCVSKFSPPKQGPPQALWMLRMFWVLTCLMVSVFSYHMKLCQTLNRCLSIISTACTISMRNRDHR